jgi:hypothetical protein
MFFERDEMINIATAVAIGNTSVEKCKNGDSYIMLREGGDQHKTTTVDIKSINDH